MGRGRRPGPSAAREDILVAARERFARDGYAQTSIRAIAAQAEVDPALVHHYFGRKTELFAAATELPADPASLFDAWVAGPVEGMGRRLAETAVGTWEQLHRQGRFAGLVRSAGGDDEVGRQIREYLRTEMVSRIAAACGGPDAEQRAALVASHLIGVAVGRYLWRMAPLADLDVRELCDRLAPALQQHLTGPVDAASDTAPGRS